MSDRDLDPVWRALADPTRRRILDLLHEGPMTTGGLAAQFPMSRIAVMKHLGLLADAGLISARKQGRERWHHVNFFPLQQIHERWLQPYADRWAGSLANLKNKAEERTETMTNADGGLPLAIDIHQDVPINAPPNILYRALTEDIGGWWGHPYLHETATGLVLETELGGRFYEVWNSNAGALLATVSVIEPDRRLELTGRLHMGVVQGVADFRLEPANDGTLLRFSHRAIGRVDDGVSERAEAGWRELLGGRLKAFAENAA